jgi:hypothetical protein
MPNAAQFFEKWTHILYTDSTVQPNGCIVLKKELYQIDSDGYPNIKVTIPGVGRTHLYGAKLMYMCHHRVTQVNGDVSHLCHQKLCVNVHHLIIEPRANNSARQACNNVGRCLEKQHDPPKCIFN